MRGPNPFRAKSVDEDDEDYEDALFEHECKRDKVWSAIVNTVGDVREWIGHYGYKSKGVQPHIMLACIKAALAHTDGKTARHAALNFMNMKMSNYSTPAAFLSAF